METSYGKALKDGTHSEAQMDIFEYMFGFAVENVANNRLMITSPYVVEWKPEIRSNGSIRQMDASALLDHEILHELTHALSQDDTDDVNGMRSYGWKRSTVIGQTPHDGKNAENYAYFGLGRRAAFTTQN
ncbi:uncharacterized protein KD926_011643 [Aspergillus affinis]|uniref:uncharacterized protein n=1 Tax=Aspergillus affinis TaxID=1070780 RepID=UPI0022FEFB4A|nr:uncharacterized protein KD926_011643 [Aspergillus affinis]KAI9044673.1 hypothetical protein KD926_011643 [Aspergillus affinis]